MKQALNFRQLKRASFLQTSQYFCDILYFAACCFCQIFTRLRSRIRLSGTRSVGLLATEVTSQCRYYEHVSLDLASLAEW